MALPEQNEQLECLSLAGRAPLQEAHALKPRESCVITAKQLLKNQAESFPEGVYLGGKKILKMFTLRSARIN